MDALADEHIWTPPLIDMRFGYKPENPLYLLLVRAYRLHEPTTVANTPAYAGCKSWVPLEQEVAVGDALPVLDDVLYAVQAENDIGETLLSHRVLTACDIRRRGGGGGDGGIQLTQHLFDRLRILAGGESAFQFRCADPVDHVAVLAEEGERAVVDAERHAVGVAGTGDKGDAGIFQHAGRLRDRPMTYHLTAALLVTAFISRVRRPKHPDVHDLADRRIGRLASKTVLSAGIDQNDIGVAAGGAAGNKPA